MIKSKHKLCNVIIICFVHCFSYNNHNNPGYSGLVKPEGFLVQQKSPEVVPLYDIIDRTVVDGPPDSAPTKYL